MGGRGRARAMAVMVLTVALIGPAPGSASAATPSEECRADLLALPVEGAPLPDGYAWDSLRPAWAGAVITTDTATGEPAWIDISLECDPDTAGVLARAAQVRDALGLEETLAARPVGEESVAVRWTEGPVTGIRIDWRDGPYLGSVANRYATDAGQAIEFGDLEELARILDGLLRGVPVPSLPGTSPAPSPEPSPSGRAPSPVAGVDRAIELQLDGALQIVGPRGRRVRTLPVTPGETIEFRLANTAGYAHSFWIGTNQQLMTGRTDGLPGLPEWTDPEPRTFVWTVPDDVTDLRFGCTVPGHYSLMNGRFEKLAPAAGAGPRARLTMSEAELRLSDLPAVVEIRLRLEDPKGRPVDGAQVTFSLSAPGQPTETFATKTVEGVATWTVELPAEGAERGNGFITASVDAGAGLGPVNATRSFVLR